MNSSVVNFFFFFFNDTPPTEIYTLSLHDALPIFSTSYPDLPNGGWNATRSLTGPRSEEHTSELQSRPHLVCRLLLEKKKKINKDQTIDKYSPQRIVNLHVHPCGQNHYVSHNTRGH